MTPTYRTILCCHDLEPRAREVLAHAFGLAKTYDARLVVVQAIEPESSQTRHMVEAFVPAEQMDGLRERARQKVTEELTGQIQELVEGERRPSLWEVRVVEGRAAEALLEVARNVGADLIVMGSHSHTAMGELLLGSTAHRVAQRSPVPVLLVRMAE